MAKHKNEHLIRHSKEDFGPWKQFLNIAGKVSVIIILACCYVLAAIYV